MVTHHFAMFGGHWSSANGDVKYLICHVTSQNHVIGGSSNFMSWTSSWYVTNLPSLAARGIVVIEMFLVSHVIKQDDVITSQVTIMIETPQCKSPPCQVWWS